MLVAHFDVCYLPAGFWLPSGNSTAHSFRCCRCDPDTGAATARPYHQGSSQSYESNARISLCPCRHNFYKPGCWDSNIWPSCQPTPDGLWNKICYGLPSALGLQSSSIRRILYCPSLSYRWQLWRFCRSHIDKARTILCPLWLVCEGKEQSNAQNVFLHSRPVYSFGQDTINSISNQAPTFP